MSETTTTLRAPIILPNPSNQPQKNQTAPIILPYEGYSSSDKETQPLLVKQTPAIEEMPTSTYLWNGKKVVIVAIGTTLAIGSTAFFVLSIIRDFGNQWNAINDLIAGFTFQAALQCTYNRINFDGKNLTKWGKALEYEKDKLVKYAAPFFFCFTQLYLNLPHPRWFVRMTYGMFSTLLGMQLATIVDNVLFLKKQDDKTLNVNFIENKGETYVTVLAGNGTWSRRSLEIGKIALGVAGVVLGNVLKGTSIPYKLGLILLGHVGGVAIHEAVAKLKHYYEKKHQETNLFGGQDSLYLPATSGTPTHLKFFYLIEKLEQIAGILLPGILIAFNTKGTDVLAGVAMGMMRQIDWLRFTKTPVDKLDELKEKEGAPRSYLRLAMDIAKWAFAIFAVGGFIVYGLYDGIANGPLVNTFALGTLGAVLYTSYLLSRFIDTRKIPGNRFLNSLFFYTNYSIAAPIIYIAITQTLKIGDYALDTYRAYGIVASCIAWGSLAWAFGTQTGARATNRMVPYPAQVDPLIILYTTWYLGIFRRIV